MLISKHIKPKKWVTFEWSIVTNSLNIIKMKLPKSNKSQLGSINLGFAAGKKVGGQMLLGTWILASLHFLSCSCNCWTGCNNVRCVQPTTFSCGLGLLVNNWSALKCRWWLVRRLLVGIAALHPARVASPVAARTPAISPSSKIRGVIQCSRTRANCVDQHYETHTDHEYVTSIRLLQSRYTVVSVDLNWFLDHKEVDVYRWLLASRIRTRFFDLWRVVSKEFW